MQNGSEAQAALQRLVDCRKMNIENARLLSGMYANDFFKKLLPYMESMKVVSKKKVDQLMDQSEEIVQRSLSTQELMALAIKWDITTSAAAFWRKNKTRDDLIHALRMKKAQLEYEPPETEDGPVELKDGFGASSVGLLDGGDAEEAIARARRRSVAKLASVVNARGYKGDLFSQRGEYSQGLLYSMRRRSIESTKHENALGITSEQFSALKAMTPGLGEAQGGVADLAAGSSGAGDVGSPAASDGMTARSSMSDGAYSVSSSVLRAAGDQVAREPRMSSKHARAEVDDDDDEDDAAAFGQAGMSPTARQLQAFVKARRLAAARSKPLADSHDAVDLWTWVKRNHEDEEPADPMDEERGYATHTVSAALGIEKLIEEHKSGLVESTVHGMGMLADSLSPLMVRRQGLERTLRGEAPSVDPDQADDVDALEPSITGKLQSSTEESVRRKVQLAKTLRGVTGVSPSPSSSLLGRSRSKLELYHKALQPLPPVEIELLPSQTLPTQAGTYPSMMTPVSGQPGTVDDFRYGFTADVHAGGRHSSIHDPHHRSEQGRAVRISKRAGGEWTQQQARTQGPGAMGSSPPNSRPSSRHAPLSQAYEPGPLPSPMFLPSPSHPIMTATTGSGTGVGAVTDQLADAAFTVTDLNTQGSDMY